jgi:FKBP-type peptidyl-prolyl cis-trans isomerase (trigger factor)
LSPKGGASAEYDLLLKEYTKDTDIKGFRKGKVPGDMISKEVREVLKFESFEKLAPLYINTALNREGLEPIAPVQYKEIPKFLEGLDVSFTITITTMPKFKLGDMKKIKVKKEKVVVNDEEIGSAIEELKGRQETKEKEVNDKWAKEIAKIIELEGVKTLVDLKEKIKDALLKQKEHYQLHQIQDDVLRQGVELCKIDIPQVGIDFESSEREKAFTEDMKGRGIKIEDFLKSNNITIEKMRELWLKDAKEALEADTFLNLYSKERGVMVSDEELEKRVEEIKKGQADIDKSAFSNDQWREYIRGIQRKEKGFRLFIEEVLGKGFLDEHN